MNCAEIKEQLVDYLYGELAANARSAFAEHLRACSGCSAEVSSHERALGHTRAALTGPLLQEPPARVRLAVLEAAKMQAKLAKQRHGDRPGFFARLWRTPWLMPAFGAASVATVVFLVRVLKNPEVVPGQRRTTIAENAPAASAPQPPPVTVLPGLAPEGAAQPDEEVTKPVGRQEQRAESGKMGARKGSGAGLKGKAPSRAPSFESFDDWGTKPRASGGRFAEPPPPRGAAKADKDVDDLSGTFKDRGFAAPAAEAPAPRARMAAPEDNREYGRPPMPLAEKKASAPEPVRRPASEPPMAAAPPPAPTPAYAPAPPQATRHGDKKKAEAEQEAAWDSAPLAAPAKAASTAHKGGSPLEESVKKADGLFAAQQWTAAAAAYRDLLNRYPSHKDAAKWRGRMNQALAADEQARAAKARAGAAANPFGDKP
jgi:hypothetical protein